MGGQRALDLDRIDVDAAAQDHGQLCRHARLVAVDGDVVEEDVVGQAHVELGDAASDVQAERAGLTYVSKKINKKHLSRSGLSACQN